MLLPNIHTPLETPLAHGHTGPVQGLAISQPLFKIHHSCCCCHLPEAIDDLLLGQRLSSVLLWITRSAPIADRRKNRDLIQSSTASCQLSCYPSVFPLKFSSRTNAKSFLYLWITSTKLTAVSFFGFEWSLEGRILRYAWVLWVW